LADLSTGEYPITVESVAKIMQYFAGNSIKPIAEISSEERFIDNLGKAAEIVTSLAETGAEGPLSFVQDSIRRVVEAIKTFGKEEEGNLFIEILDYVEKNPETARGFIKTPEIQELELVERLEEILREIEKIREITELSEKIKDTLDEIRKSVENVKGAELTDRQRKNISVILSYVEETISITNEISGRIEKDLVVKELQIDELIKSVVGEEKAERISRINPPEGSTFIQGVEDITRPIFRKLIRNAKNRGADKIEINIKEDQEKEKLIISVKDNGKPISDEDKGRIYRKNYASTTDEGLDGIGLDLKLHDGTINIVPNEVTVTLSTKYIEDADRTFRERFLKETVQYQLGNALVSIQTKAELVSIAKELTKEQKKVMEDVSEMGKTVGKYKNEILSVIKTVGKEQRVQKEISKLTPIQFTVPKVKWTKVFRKALKKNKIPYEETRDEHGFIIISLDKKELAGKFDKLRGYFKKVSEDKSLFEIDGKFYAPRVMVTKGEAINNILLGRSGTPEKFGKPEESTDSEIKEIISEVEKWLPKPLLPSSKETLYDICNFFISQVKEISQAKEKPHTFLPFFSVRDLGASGQGVKHLRKNGLVVHCGGNIWKLGEMVENVSSELGHIPYTSHQFSELQRVVGGYLFSIDAKVAGSKLSKKIIPTELRRKFRVKGSPPSKKATIRKEKKYLFSFS
ncbi:MAG: HAMP domain-containing histidine kinase, partial [Candidatus Altiarchaeales archaeon]|nr:HAMP domain-containing histidine kinase [Candidatus Altiarchaeales archaeon]